MHALQIIDLMNLIHSQALSQGRGSASPSASPGRSSADAGSPSWSVGPPVTVLAAAQQV